ncbi:MAG: hypothetical protein ACREQ9_03930, partial [Candidatus Binatia bacterium]
MNPPQVMPRAGRGIAEEPDDRCRSAKRHFPIGDFLTGTRTHLEVGGIECPIDLVGELTSGDFSRAIDPSGAIGAGPLRPGSSPRRRQGREAAARRGPTEQWA